MDRVDLLGELRAALGVDRIGVHGRQDALPADRRPGRAGCAAGHRGVYGAGT